MLADPKWPPEFPFGARELSRYDESPDSVFYSAPRFVTHIDDAAIGALTKYYAAAFPPSGRADTALLDICSSWISHYPPGYTAGRISGLGMNEAEARRLPPQLPHAPREPDQRAPRRARSWRATVC